MMAERRMFAKSIIDSDVFLDMPLSTQALYFHLSMRADDDGFINNPKRICRTIGCSGDDMKLLAAKQFIIPFESGIVVIKHWRIHNYIQADRKKTTEFLDELDQLEVGKNKAYNLKDTPRIQSSKPLDTECIQSGYSLVPQVRVGKESIDKDIYNTSYSPELKSSEASEKPFITFPCIKDETFEVTNEYLEQLKGYYPGIDVEQQIRNMRSWIDGNPNQRKTHQGMKRFIANWLNREQNKARPETKAQPQKTGFHNFTEREYEYDSHGFPIITSATDDEYTPEEMEKFYRTVRGE